MVYNYSDLPDFDTVASVRIELASLFEFIFERKTAVKLSDPEFLDEFAGVRTYRVTGEFASGKLRGRIRFEYSDNPEERQSDVDTMDIYTEDLGWSPLDFSNTSTLLDSMMNKVKLISRLADTKPARMEKIKAICDRMLSEQLPNGQQEAQAKLAEYANEILKEIE